MAVSTESKEKLLKTIESNDEIEITVIGRKSGNPVTTTVWFVLEDSTVYLLPVKGRQTQWFKNLLERPSLKLRAAGVESEFTATAITEADQISAVVKKFEQKHGVGDVKKYYSNFDAAVRVSLN